jgi:hypothetical protein
MNTWYRSLLVVGAPPIVGSFIVLFLAGVGSGIWMMHLSAIFVAGGLAWLGGNIGKLSHRLIAGAIMAAALIGLAIPLFDASSYPQRWVSLGPLKLYIAPVVLPSLIAVCAISVSTSGSATLAAFAAVFVAILLLALQPDASQALGLLMAALVVLVQQRLALMRACVAVIPLVLATLWAFSRPDPLTPVPHVEEVFALTLRHSFLAGAITIASALALLVGLWIHALKGADWLVAIAVYYAALFVCSTAGMTPAPLLGYGAGPVLGFGLMVGLRRMLARSPRP